MIRLRGVGECCIETGTARLGSESELAFAVLLVLVLARERPVARRQLIDLLWPATSERRARHNLRQTLYKLRQLGVPLRAGAHDVALAAGAVAADPLLDADPDAPLPAELLRPDAPFGEFLAGYAPAVSEAFARWVEEQRALMHGRLRRLVTGALLDERRRGSWGAVETLARKALQLDPLNEEATLALAEATALTGSKRAALAILDGYLQELGADDAPELRLPASLLRRRIADRLLPHAAPADAETSFVGRAESMAVLAAHFQRVRQGTGQALLVWGDQGIGKSRLLGEFASLATLDGARVVRVPCQSRDVDRPLSVFVDGVPELLALPGALGCAPESMGYLKRLTDHDPDMLEPSAETREAELLFAGVRRAILDLLDAVAGESPLLLWIEDAHWLDQQSWRVLREVIDWLPPRPILLLLTSRLPHATPAPPARTTAGLVPHRVPALADDAARRVLLDSCAGREPPAAFRDWCLQVAEGNPFHLRSLAHHWVETGDLRAPASLCELVVARLRRLPELPLRTLQACAILAKNATAARLERVLEYRRHALVNALALLEAEGLLATAGPAVPCRHSLIADAALSMLPDATRRLLHRCAARVLQQEIEGSQSASLLWDCAQQWEAAGEADQALRLVRSCATHLLEMGLPSDAAEVYEQAVDRCNQPDDLLDMLDRWSYALFLSGRWERLKPVISQVTALQREIDPLCDEHDHRELLLLEAEWRTGRDMRELLGHAEACTFNLNAAPSHRLSAAGMALILADNLCDTATAARVYEGVQCLVDYQAIDLAARLRVRVIFNAVYGDIGTAIESAEEWVLFERASGDPARLARALRSAATPLRLAGMFDRAFSVLLESYGLSARYQLASSAANCADILATMNTGRGDLRNGRLWYRRANQWLQQVEESTSTASIRRVGARLALEDGNWQKAIELLDLSEECLDTDSAIRRRVEGYALFTHCMLTRSPAVLSQSLVDRYLLNYRAVCDRGGQDYATEILLRALCRQEMRLEAESLLSEYSQSLRRELGPIPERVKAAIT